MRTSQIGLRYVAERDETNLMEWNVMVKLEVVKKEENDFVVKVPGRQETVRIEDTFAETCSHMVTTHSVFR